MVFIAFDAEQDLVACPQIEDLNLVLGQRAEPPLVERVKLEIEDLLALMVLSNYSLLVEALPGVAKLDLVLSCKDKLKFTLWQPSYRKDIFSDVVERLKAICDDLWTFTRFNFPKADALTLNAYVAGESFFRMLAS